MIARIDFALRTPTPVRPVFSNGYRQRGDTIHEALAVADRCTPGVPLSADDSEAVQVVIDSGEAWARGDTFALKMLAFISRGQATLARRSYAPNPKRVSTKGIKP
ncbi:MAG: hypothetical protein PSV22_12005 [Pseudolabrys sp.]|jgi:hypothetical protein|nr:hypothetical protein [Pseudolabrys sp.]